MRAFHMRLYFYIEHEQQALNFIFDCIFRRTEGIEVNSGRVRVKPISDQMKTHEVIFENHTFVDLPRLIDFEGSRPIQPNQ